LILLPTPSQWLFRFGRSAGQPVLALFLAVTLAGCESRGVPESRSLDDSLLVEVLVDLHLSQAREMSYPDESFLRADSVLAVHGVSRAMLERSLERMEEEGRPFSDLYARVIERLAVIDAEYSTWKEAVERIARETPSDDDASR
jgi:hypothetical protein